MKWQRRSAERRKTLEYMERKFERDVYRIVDQVPLGRLLVRLFIIGSRVVEGAKQCIGLVRSYRGP